MLKYGPGADGVRPQSGLCCVFFTGYGERIVLPAWRPLPRVERQPSGGDGLIARAIVPCVPPCFRVTAGRRRVADRRATAPASAPAIPPPDT